MHFNYHEQNKIVKQYGGKSHQIIDSFNKAAHIFTFEGLKEADGYCIEFGDNITAHSYIENGIACINLCFAQKFDQETIKLLQTIPKTVNINLDGSIDNEILDMIISYTPVKSFISSIPIGYSVSVWEWLGDICNIVYHIEFPNKKVQNFLLKRLIKRLVMQFGTADIAYVRTFDGSMIGEWTKIDI